MFHSLWVFQVSIITDLGQICLYSIRDILQYLTLLCLSLGARQPGNNLIQLKLCATIAGQFFFLIYVYMCICIFLLYEYVCTLQSAHVQFFKNIHIKKTFPIPKLDIIFGVVLKKLFCVFETAITPVLCNIIQPLDVVVEVATTNQLPSCPLWHPA